MKKLKLVGIKENLARIKEQIGNNNVKLIAVTKYASTEQIYEAYKLGITDFAESYVQDALEKISQKYQDEKFVKEVNWHFIGRLQKNKVKSVVGKFRLIHSAHSEGLTECISQTASKIGIIQDVLFQVNILEDPTKAGFKIDKLRNSFSKLVELTNINVLGLMTIAPNTKDREIIKNCFSSLFSLQEELNKEYRTNLKELSMGMSNDYEVAIQCGATMIRIGRAIFT